MAVWHAGKRRGSQQDWPCVSPFSSHCGVNTRRIGSIPSPTLHHGRSSCPLLPQALRRLTTPRRQFRLFEIADAFVYQTLSIENTLRRFRRPRINKYLCLSKLQECQHSCSTLSRTSPASPWGLRKQVVILADRLYLLSLLYVARPGGAPFKYKKRAAEWTSRRCSSYSWQKRTADVRFATKPAHHSNDQWAAGGSVAQTSPSPRQVG